MTADCAVQERLSDVRAAIGIDRALEQNIIKKTKDPASIFGMLDDIVAKLNVCNA